MHLADFSTDHGTCPHTGWPVPVAAWGAAPLTPCLEGGTSPW